MQHSYKVVLRVESGRGLDCGLPVALEQGDGVRARDGRTQAPQIVWNRNRLKPIKTGLSWQKMVV
jgi:hypothetical protein